MLWIWSLVQIVILSVEVESDLQSLGVSHPLCLTLVSLYSVRKMQSQSAVEITPTINSIIYEGHTIWVCCSPGMYQSLVAPPPETVCLAERYEPVGEEK